MQSILSSLHSLPDLGILLIMVLLIGGMAMAAPHVGRKIFRIKTTEKRSDAAVDAFKAVMSMTGVVLAFALVQANANLNGVSVLVAREAAALSMADRALLRSGNPQLIALRPALAAYGQSIVDDEWPTLAEEADRSDTTDDAYNLLSKQARAVEPTDARQQTIFAELLRGLDDLADLREQRIAESEADLPAFFWVTALGFLTVALAMGMLTEATLENSVTLGATAAAIALLVSFVVIVDQPFEGETSVKPKEIVKALALNARRK